MCCRLRPSFLTGPQQFQVWIDPVNRLGQFRILLGQSSVTTADLQHHRALELKVLTQGSSFESVGISNYFRGLSPATRSLGCVAKASACLVDLAPFLTELDFQDTQELFPGPYCHVVSLGECFRDLMEVVVIVDYPG